MRNPTTIQGVLSGVYLEVFWTQGVSQRRMPLQDLLERGKVGWGGIYVPGVLLNAMVDNALGWQGGKQGIIWPSYPPLIFP